jgi:glycosyltransferase involved in cell wall biosynthesis
MPLSVLEAMAAGLPVVACDVGDVSRAVLDGRTGLLVPPKSVGRLADALETLLTDEELRRSMGAAGRAHVAANFSLHATAQALGALYSELDGSSR